MNDSVYKIIHYIQKALFEGKQPNKDSFYVFSRKEISDNIGVSVTTVSNNIDDVVKYFSEWCDLFTWAKYKEYAGEILYINVSYARGKLKFQRNPITLQHELQHLWALPPLSDQFAYDAFDDKHRRRCNSSKKVYDAIPWSWDI